MGETANQELDQGWVQLGGGAGGIIQIISPAGRLPLEALSLKRGTKYAACFKEAEHGYYYFVGGNFSSRTIRKCILPVSPLLVQMSMYMQLGNT